MLTLKMPVRRAPTGHRIGESHPRAKLTDEIVRQIRALHAKGQGSKSIARQLDLPRDTVRDVIDFRTWKHVEDAHVQPLSRATRAMAP